MPGSLNLHLVRPNAPRMVTANNKRKPCATCSCVSPEFWSGRARRLASRLQVGRLAHKRVTLFLLDILLAASAWREDLLPALSGVAFLPSRRASQPVYTAISPAALPCAWCSHGRQGTPGRITQHGLRSSWASPIPSTALSTCRRAEVVRHLAHAAPEGLNMRLVHGRWCRRGGRRVVKVRVPSQLESACVVSSRSVFHGCEDPEMLRRAVHADLRLPQWAAPHLKHTLVGNVVLASTLAAPRGRWGRRTLHRRRRHGCCLPRCRLPACRRYRGGARELLVAYRAHERQSSPNPTGIMLNVPRRLILGLDCRFQSPFRLIQTPILDRGPTRSKTLSTFFSQSTSQFARHLTPLVRGVGDACWAGR